MERLVRYATKKYTNLLPEVRPFYTLEELKSFDIPDFLLQRIDIEIRNRLNDSIVPPHSDWTGMTTEKVTHAWEQFIEAVVSERRLLANYAAEIIEMSLNDIAGLILKPRTAIPSILFGSGTVLQKDQIRKRIKLITVNTHLANAILKYMYRRKKNELDIETCRNVVEKVDERLTQNYSARDWAKQMEPLYILSGPKVDSELFRIFFDSRNMDVVAHRFDLLTDYLTIDRFIEVMEGDEVPAVKQEELPLMSAAAEYSGQAERNHAQKTTPGTTFFEPSEPDTGETPEEEEDQPFTPQKNKKEEVREEESSRKPAEDEEPEDTLLSSFQSDLRGYDFPFEEEAEEDATDADYFNYYGLQDEEDDTDDSEKDSEPSLYSLFMEQDEDEDENEDEEVSDEQLSDQPWDYVDKTKEERTFSGSFFDDDEKEIEKDEETDEGTDKEEVISEKTGEIQPEINEPETREGFIEEETRDDFIEDEKEAEDEKAADLRTEKEEKEKEKEVDTSPDQKFLFDEAEIETEDEIPAEDTKPKDAETAPDYEMVEIKEDAESAGDENETSPADDDVDEAFLFGEKNEVENAAENKTDRPIWQAFLGDEDHIDEEELDDAGYYAFNELDEEDDDPIMSQLIEAEKKENVQKLISWLKEDEKRFIKTIFNGSQNDYENALIKLDEFDSWKQAASYIGKEIFARNSVNMYDDDAVDFTDRLQAYFEKYKT
jgi:hypothetical protein